MGRPDARTTVCPFSCISISAAFVSGVIFFSELVNVPSKSSTNTFLSISIPGSFLTLRKLAVIQVCIESVLCKQAFMAALLNNVTILHHQNNIGIFDR